MKNKLSSFILPLAILAAGSLANAGTIGGAGSTCGSCDGALYTLSYSGSPISSTAQTQTFQITFDVNDSTYTGGGSYLHAAAIKVAPSSSILSASLVSAPTGFALFGVEGLGSNGCSSGNAGYVCFQSFGRGAAVAGSPFDFVFNVTVQTGTLLTGLDGASAKALYVNAQGLKTGALFSENITLGTPTSATPEPGSYLLMGSGLAALALLLRRRTAKQN